MEPMEVTEFESKLQEIRARNGWVIELELCGIWIINVFDKETMDKVAFIGTTGLYGVLHFLIKLEEEQKEEQKYSEIARKDFERSIYEECDKKDMEDADTDSF